MYKKRTKITDIALTISIYNWPDHVGKRGKNIQTEKKSFGPFFKRDEKTIVNALGLKWMEKWKIEMSGIYWKAYIGG